MALITNKPSGNWKSTFTDALVIAGVKTAEEKLLARFIGNGTFVSGLAKGGIAVAISAIGKNNKYANLATTAFVVDSAEDLINAGMQYFGWGGPTESGMVI